MTGPHFLHKPRTATPRPYTSSKQLLGSATEFKITVETKALSPDQESEEAVEQAECRKKLPDLNKLIAVAQQSNTENYWDLLQQRGDCLLVLRNDEAALNDFNSALQKCPKNTIHYADLLIRIGIMHLLLNQAENALSSFGDVQRLKLDSKSENDVSTFAASQKTAATFILDIEKVKAAPKTPRP